MQERVQKLKWLMLFTRKTNRKLKIQMKECCILKKFNDDILTPLYLNTCVQ